MHRPKLILLNGPPGIGKTTIARRYLETHALTLGIDGDALIAMLGQWPAHEPEARRMSFNFTYSMAGIHLASGHDVVLPFLVLRPEQARRFEVLAKQHDAQFYEILLNTDKEDAVRRLFRRGTWGEPGAPPVTETDRPIIENFYDRMMAAVAKRPHIITLGSVDGDVEATYRQFLNAVAP